MDTNELQEILTNHRKWLNSEDGGMIADLRGSDLRRADLRGADLKGADLWEANLSNAILGDDKHIYQVSGFGSERRQTTYWVEEDKIWCGCFTGTLDEFAAAIEKTHADNREYLDSYRAVVTLFRMMKEKI